MEVGGLGKLLDTVVTTLGGACDVPKKYKEEESGGKGTETSEVEEIQAKKGNESA